MRGVAHLGVLVGKVEVFLRDLDGDRLIAIEGEEPDAGSALIVVDVGADVEFLEPRKPRHGWQEARADSVHEEWDYADPGLAVEGVDMQAFG